MSFVLIHLLMLTVIGLGSLLGNNCQAQTPTPTCNPTSVVIEIHPDDPDPTYFPGSDLVVSLSPQLGSDWPTTPSAAKWGGDYFGSFWGEIVAIFHIPDLAPDTVYITGKAFGNAIRPDCQNWNSNTAAFTARRYDYIPPTPTPMPTVSPTETPTPSWTPVNCGDRVIRPPEGAENVWPEQVIIEHAGVEFLGLYSEFGARVPVTQLDEKVWLAENLEWDMLYMWYFVGDYWPDGSPATCFTGFFTAPEPTPSPEPTPTASPYPTPTPISSVWMLTGSAAAGPWTRWLVSLSRQGTFPGERGNAP